MNIPEPPHTKIKLPESLFDGYISEEGEGVFISAIESKNKGNGDFSRLLKQLKENYKWIKIPTPSNQMRKITERKGFILIEEFFPFPFNCMGKVMFWEKDSHKA